MPLWTYSDWITYDVGDANRLTRLRQHIQEVSEQVLSTQTRTTNTGAVDPEYIAGLRAEEQRLTGITQGRQFARNQARFRNY